MKNHSLHHCCVCACTSIFLFGFLSCSTPTSSDSKQSSQSHQAAEPQRIPTIDDYPEILEQALVCEQKFRQLQNEIENIVPRKATMSTYQGIYAQRILFDANDYMREYETETRKLIRLLKQYNFYDKARTFESDLKEKKTWYNDYHDEVMRTLGIW